MDAVARGIRPSGISGAVPIHTSREFDPSFLCQPSFLVSVAIHGYNGL